MNQLIPAKDVGKVFLDAAREAAKKAYEDAGINPTEEEIDKLAGLALIEMTQGLFWGDALANRAMGGGA